MISLIITVLNEKNNIKSWFESILLQSALPDEIVVVDGGSDDGTFEILLELSKENKLLKVLQKKGNISSGRNFAIENCSYEIVVATDAGCIYAKDWFEKITEPVLSGDFLVSSTAFGSWLQPDDSFVTNLIAASTTPAKKEFLRKNWLPSSRSLCFKRSVWDKVGGYPEWIPICEDIIFDLKIKKIGINFGYIREVLVFWRPRISLPAYFKQLFRYTKSDGHGKLWFRRQMIRYGVYLLSLIFLFLAFKGGLLPFMFLFIGMSVYVYKFWCRWLEFTSDKSFFYKIFGLMLVPFIVALGDLAKMSGWPVGVMERWSGKIKFENF